MAKTPTLCFEETILLMDKLDPEEHILLLIGPPGVAKTSVGKAFCKRRNIPSSRQAGLSIALNETGDIVGFPYKVQTEDGSDSGRMGFAVPPWWLGQYNEDGTKRSLEEIHKPYDDGLEYFLDVSEANRGADREKQAAIINLTLERQIQGRYLPQRTYIMMSVNEGDDYMVEDFDPAVRNRLMPIYFRPHIREWKVWFANSKHHNPFVEDFVSGDQGRKVFIPIQSEIASGEQFSSPRSLAKLGALLNSWGVKDLDTLAALAGDTGSFKVFNYGVKSLIGLRAGDMFYKFLETSMNDSSARSSRVKAIKNSNDPVENLRRLPGAERRRAIKQMTPINVQNLMAAFIAHIGSDDFVGWSGNSDDRMIVTSIIEVANIPREDKLVFLDNVVNTRKTTQFDMAINDLRDQI